MPEPNLQDWVLLCGGAVVIAIIIIYLTAAGESPIESTDVNGPLDGPQAVNFSLEELYIACQNTTTLARQQGVAEGHQAGIQAAANGIIQALNAQGFVSLTVIGDNNMPVTVNLVPVQGGGA